MDLLWPGRDRAVPARHQPVRAAAVRAAVGQRRHRVVLFAGAGAQFARETYAEYPPGALNTRHGNAPTLRHLLAATPATPAVWNSRATPSGRGATTNASPPTGSTCSPTPPPAPTHGGRRRTTTASSVPRRHPTTSTSSTSP